ncbi:hypothetical protein ACFLXC_03400 [Chloroflexota bacterium]
MQTRHKLFIVFLVMAMVWSIADYIFHSTFLPQYDVFLLKAIIILFTATIVHFYLFASHYFQDGKGRWIPFAYFAIVLVTGMVSSGQIPKEFVIDGAQLYPRYGESVFFLAIPLLILIARSVFILWQRLKILDNPVMRNQLLSIIFSIFILVVFSSFAIVP